MFIAQEVYAGEPTSKECPQWTGIARYKITARAMDLFYCGNDTDEPSVSLSLTKGQMSISDPAFSKNHNKIGWLINYPDEANPGVGLAQTLVIHEELDKQIEITVPDVIFGWEFSADGKKVIITHGPLHFSPPVEDTYLLEPVRSKQVKE